MDYGTVQPGGVSGGREGGTRARATSELAARVGVAGGDTGLGTACSARRVRYSVPWKLLSYH